MSNTNTFLLNGQLRRVTPLPSTELNGESTLTVELRVLTEFPALANQHVLRAYGRQAQKAQVWWAAAGGPVDVLVNGSVYSVDGQVALVVERLTFYAGAAVRAEALAKLGSSD